ncbi:FAA hydrolase family protein [Massilia arenosa]|uniref:FAA hydrolase family protein n=1 Tax=Zemynaea arenosa TaxID=2561931 RepID=A0A4Y9S4H0_9BURK|nr:fumarylacetoacetate hydrolase family protein [Massilia arenosa]TFW16424.1 FAA hydrolase family protein [Massilia arenosa]
MTDTVFKLEQPTAAIAGGTSRFPIRRVFCVGRNYAAHAREMGSDPTREAPFFFMKPADAVVAAEGTLPYPPLTGDLHHEIELVVAVGGTGVNLTPEQARSLVWGYGVGVDLTRRDLQAEAKNSGRPWDWAKGFDASGPCSPLVPVQQTGWLETGRIWLKVNGELRQQGDLADMIYNVAEVLSHISHSVALRPGDLVFTGTPSGVAPLAPGDQVTAGVDGVAQISFHVGARPKAV